MRLQSLELVGFKTFADATRLAFDQGVTAIIGPNGSGKSNLADALLWVLAERRLSALRASEGTDVIFAGSDRRRPLGYAEVTLTIDNASRTLPLELNEVAVTRRVHRNGDNEYLLNHRRCRRKDIVDLFLDTGVGRQSFSVISQREIDAILSIDPEDRRRLIEEVAGIERYRSRRDETMRRLEDTAANLTRLGDLMVGLELQLGPLDEQRQIATRYLELRDQAEQLKLSLLVKDYQLLERRLLRSDEELGELRQAIESARTQVVNGEAAEQTARADLLRLDDELTAARDALGQTASEVERHESRIRIGEERVANLVSRRDEAVESLRRHDTASRTAAAELAALNGERERLAAELATARATLAQREAELARQRSNEPTDDDTLRQRRTALGELERAISGLVSRLETTATADGESARRRDSLIERQRAEATAREAATTRLAAATAELAQVTAAATAAREARQGLLVRVAELDRRRSAARDRSADLQADRAERAARLGVLQAAAESYEGLFRGVKAVLQARDRGRLRGDYAVVAEVLEVAEGCEVAIEAALGGRLQDLICETAEDATAAIEFLKQDRSGRATFLPLEILEPGQPLRDRARLSRIPGVIGHALDLVDCRPPYDLARQHLLSAVVVVEDLDAGLAVRRAGFGRLTIVTRDGDLIRTSGAMTGGSREGRGPSLLSRKREIEALERQVATLAVALEDARREAAEHGEQRAALGRELEAAEQAAEAGRAAVSEAERTRLERQAAVGQQQAEAARLAETLAELDRQIEQRAATAAAARDELAAKTLARDELAAGVAAEEARVREARAEQAAVNEALGAVRVEVARLDSRRQGLDDSIIARQRATAAAADERARLARLAEVWQRERDKLAGELAELNRQRSDQLVARSEQTAAVAALQAMRKDAGREVETAVAATRLARQALADGQAALHRAELRRTQVDGDLAHLRRSLADDHHGLTFAQAAARATELPNRQQSAEELDHLRAKLAELGDVNVGAIEEYERISQQLLFYDRQKADLEQAREDLLLVIAEIDTVTEEKLGGAFVAVRREFTSLFQRIFGEQGQANLSWTDPENILASGVEVEVRLPGKRTQNILLLSGGERAMTTITLLLAMFRVKPSPFCLLDELDAPLDDANLKKYRALLREFSEQSQFIVITHNPETTRAADVLYGITMAEPGVSQAYSHRPPRESAAPDEAIRAAG